MFASGHRPVANPLRVVKSAALAIRALAEVRRSCRFQECFDQRVGLAAAMNGCRVTTGVGDPAAGRFRPSTLSESLNLRPGILSHDGKHSD